MIKSALRQWRIPDKNETTQQGGVFSFVGLSGKTKNPTIDFGKMRAFVREYFSLCESFKVRRIRMVWKILTVSLNGDLLVNCSRKHRS